MTADREPVQRSKAADPEPAHRLNVRVYLAPMRVLGGIAAVLTLLVAAAPAPAEFPYPAPKGDPADYTQYRLPGGTPAMPNDLTGKLSWMYAATPPAGVDPLTAADPRELNGVRGAHLADPADVDQAWRTTTGRPDVAIAVLDSGIDWSSGNMRDIRFKTRISTGETPPPNANRTAGHEGADCAAYAQRAGGGRRDLNGDGVFNLRDFACDDRVDIDPPKGVGWRENGEPRLDPQDLLIAFTGDLDGDGDPDDDANGYPDDMVGWDFLDDDNDPYDDVRYGHGTGEAKDSAGEADNGGDLGTCPNCMEIHLRVGTSFVADVNRFAMAVLYAVDNDVLVVQEALGTLNKSRIGADAVRYAYDHGVAVIASAADEAAQHHNWPSSYPHSIVVNSVTHFDDADALPGPLAKSYLQFNGCTNFSSRITLAIPSVSCSSDATGRGAGMAGIVYSAALNAIEAGSIEAHPTCVRTNGDPCPLSANEVRQLMASGTVDGVQLSDDVNFSQEPLTGTTTELFCPVPLCTDPFLAAPTTRGLVPPNTFPRSYPAREGHDQFYGYGRVNVNRAVDATDAGELPPEVEVLSPDWYGMVDPGDESFEVRGQVWARGASYSCEVQIAPGGYPGTQDFVTVPSPWCGQSRTDAYDGVLADVSVADLKALFPPGGPAGDFDGREPGATEQAWGGRPNNEAYSFVVRVVAKSGERTGTDMRQAYLHRDKDLVDGFPIQLDGDVEASPVLADLDGDNRTELVVANSDGEVHAFRRDGSELWGRPALTDPLPRHLGQRAYAEGFVEEGHGAVLGTPAIGDLDRDGEPEVVVADMESKVYVLDGATGRRERELAASATYAGRPQAPFVNTRDGERNRTQPGFIASPVLADLDGDDGGRLEIIAAALDRHVYAFNDDGSAVPGWPVLVVDRSKLAAIDPETHKVTFKPDSGALMNGAIVDTPAVGDLTGDGRPEVVVGTNEEYAEPLNAGGLNEVPYQVLGQALSLANGRLFAIRPEGEPGGPSLDSAPWLEGWPFKVGILQAEVLPLVGEGITGSPVIGEVPCGTGGTKPTVGTIPAAGVGYLVGPDGVSCQGRVNGKDVGLNTEGGAAADQPFIAAFGHPIFAPLGQGMSFIAPAAGLQRALDVVLPEYQGGHDYLVAWSTTTGEVQPGWPAEVNDLQFLTGPSAADVDAVKPGQEILGATAHSDLQGFDSLGRDISPDWPKLTADWSVANPVIGVFGQKETDPDAQQVVVHGTRNGRLLAWATDGGACAQAAWPRFHHDLANSGDARRDATAPGTPEEAALSGDGLSFLSPGDDLLCGTPAAYEVATAPHPIDGKAFAKADPVAHTAAPVAAGERATIALPAGALERYVAVRAVDEQGNPGRVAVVDRGTPAASPQDRSAGAVPDAGAPASIAPPAGTEACLPAGLRGRAGTLGPLRLGASPLDLAATAGPPQRQADGWLRWCVVGGGSVTAFVRGGAVEAIVSTAPGHRVRGARVGARLRGIRARRRVRPHMFRTGRRAIFGDRRGRVRYVGLASPAALKRSAELRRRIGRAAI